MPKAGEPIPAPKDGGPAKPMPNGKDAKEVSSSIQPAPALDLTPPAAPKAPIAAPAESKEPF
jgi:hypothetical protein